MAGLFRAIVTGASSGIGRAVSVELAGRRVEVILVGRRDAVLHEVKASIEEHGGYATVIAGDITHPTIAEQIVEIAREPTDNSTPILINSAGVATFGAFHEFEVRDVHEQIQVNLIAPMLLTRAILPWMLEQGRGQIVNVLSVAAVETLGGSAAYTAAKAGLLSFGKVISAEYRKQGIRVAAFIPGATDTPLWNAQSFQPPREDMLSVSAVARVIADIVTTDAYRNVDEIRMMPEKGIL